MKPRLLNLAAAVSLLLAIAIAALWVRSYWHADRVSRGWYTSTQEHTQMASSWSSGFSLMTNYVSGTFHPIDPMYNYMQWTPRSGTVQPPRWFPFPPVWLLHSAGTGYDQRVIGIAYWLLLLPTLPLPLIAVARHRRQRRHAKNNLCPTCGYDLRATPDRCPECGAVPVSVVVGSH